MIVDDDGVIKILAIGNSFSQDATEQNLYEIITSEGIPVIIGNMYIAGCSLERHLKNSGTDAKSYSYRKITNGNKKTTDNVSISKALKDENWDFVTLQQSSPFCGVYPTYARDLPPLLEYVKETNPKRKHNMPYTKLGHMLMIQIIMDLGFIKITNKRCTIR